MQNMADANVFLSLALTDPYFICEFRQADLIGAGCKPVKAWHETAPENIPMLSP